MPRVQGHAKFEIATEYQVFVPKEAESGGSYPLLIALHGMGQTAQMLADQIEDICAGPRIVLVPNGPLPLEIREEGAMREGFAWYIYTGDQEAFIESAARTESYLFGLIASLKDKYPIDPEQIFIMGYSQGGYLAGIMTLRHPDYFAGLISVSSRIKVELIEGLEQRERPPILVVHGSRDKLIPIEMVRDSVSRLEELGIDIELKPSPAGHRMPAEGWKAVQEWLEAREANPEK